MERIQNQVSGAAADRLSGKAEMRKRLASLSFSEKLELLKKLRNRSLAIAAAGLRPKRQPPDQ
jgi:hypothetical protein